MATLIQVTPVEQIKETQCGARHPRYMDVRCTQDMDAHPAWHEAPGQIVWALDAVSTPANAQVHYAALMAGTGREILTEFAER
jgi:hypothetical protein